MKNPALALPRDQNKPSAPLVIPAKLYGRDNELKFLSQAFAEVGAGYGLVLRLPGPSGTGKTALIRELRRPVHERSGFFIEGKFNQFQQEVPLFAIRQALQHLARELLSADLAGRLRWREHILRAVGELGRLLTELAPDLEVLLGPQPAVPDISPWEAPHRFASTLGNFLGVFCKAEHPVVLFVDDWQWADAASLTVLQHLRINTDLRYLLFVVAYRDNEVDPVHPFSAALEELHRRAVPVRVLEVHNLALSDVRALLGDVLRPSLQDLDKLAALVHAGTRGNPFFIRALLESLHANQELWCDQSSRSWRWEADRIITTEASDVVELFVRRLHRLPADGRELLSLAACLGNSFQLETLALASRCSVTECLERLRDAFEQKIILPAEGNQNRPWTPAADGSDRLVFQHDCVQQAAHSLIAPADLPGVKLGIGRLLVSQLAAQQLDDRLLEVTSLLNAGRSLLTDEAEQLRLVEMNVAAGRKARAAPAYGFALKFHRTAAELLARPEFAGMFWECRYDTAIQLFKDWAESEFLQGDQAAAERCIQEAVTHARTPLEQADVLCILIMQYTLLARYPEAIAAGCQALASLGVVLPESDFEVARDAEIGRVRALLAGRPVSSVRALPVMTDPAMLIVTKVLITMGPPCYRSHQLLWSVIVPKVVGLTLQSGHIPQVGYSHTAFSGLLCWVANDYTTAREFGELATVLMDEVFRAPSDQSVFHLMIGSSHRHWFRHLSSASQDYAQAWEAGLRSGNLQYAAYAFGHNMYCRFFQGVPLSGLIEESRHSLDFSRTRTNQWGIDLLEGGLAVFGSLAECGDAAFAPDPSAEAEYLRRVELHKNTQVACIYRILKTTSLLILGRHEQALVLSDETVPLIYTVGPQGLLPWPEHVFTRSLLLAVLLPEAGSARQIGWREEIQRSVEQIGIWAGHCPENYHHKHALVRAEQARLDGRVFEALLLYDEAIQAARKDRFVHWEAWANERAAGLSKACGQVWPAQIYWQNAYCCYHCWGSAAKLRLMEAEFMDSLTSGFADALQGGAGSRTQASASLRGWGEHHLQDLRKLAVGKADEDQHSRQTRLVEELALAAEHLRMEVAERKQVEASLAEKAALLEAAHEGILVKDLEDRISFWNKGAERIYGWKAEEVLGRKSKELFATSPEDFARAHEHLLKNGAWSGEIRGRVRDGHDITIQAHWTLVRDDRGKAKSILAFNTDITEHKKLEQQFLRSQRMESIGTLAGGIAHDLNNLLAPITMGVGLLRQFDSDARSLSVIESIDRSAKRGADLVKQVLSFARGVEGTRRTIQAGHIIREVQSIVENTFPKNIVIRTAVARNLWPVLADPTQLNQVLLNLCVNARDALPHGGQLELTAVNIEIDAQFAAMTRSLLPGRYIVIQVIDTGCGMPPEIVDRIFEPFFTTKEVGKGTGLGLSTVLGIVHSHGGIVHVHSEPAKGTTFKVYLPAESDGTAADAHTAPAEELPRGNGELILVVDDETAIREITKATLENFGYRAITAEDGAQAVALYAMQRDEIAVVITDMMMPVMDGPVLVVALRRLNPAVRLIASSGLTSRSNTPCSVEAGVKHFLAKPYSADALLTTVRELLRNGNSRHPF